MIRPASRDDIPRIAEIHADAWHAAYRNLVSGSVLAGVTPESRLAAWSEWIEDENNRIAVLVEGGSILGFTMVCPARDIDDPPPGYAELTHLYLDPDQIGRGRGHTLFEEATAFSKKGSFAGMLLWTLEGNANARAFYESHGMATDGARHDEPEWLGEGVYEVRYRVAFD